MFFLLGGYTRLDSQAETTGKGPFDLRAIMIRKQMFQRNEGVAECYPNVDDINLGCTPGEILVFRKGLRTTSRSGARSVAVFSSLNGEHWGRYKSRDGWKRDHAIAGICKTLYQLPGAASTASARGSDYQTDSGLAWLESGSISASRNTGPETINAGDLVFVDLPPTSSQLSGTGSLYLSPNNPNGGMPLGKYVMVTRPYHAEDQVGHLCTISALLRRSKATKIMPGILGRTFKEAHFGHESGRPGNSLLTDSSLEALTCFQFSWGLFFALYEQLLNTARTNTDLKAAFGAIDSTSSQTIHASLLKLFEELRVTDLAHETVTTNASINIFDYVMLQHNALTDRRQRAMKEFQDRNKDALDDRRGPLRVRQEDGTPYEYAFLTQAPLQGLYQSFARSAAHTDAWIIGRALSRAAPGETLDLLVACRTRPTNR